MKTSEAPQIHFFKSQSAWERWLAKNHTTSGGIWLQLMKKDARAAAKNSLTYAEALDAALCYGWIDGQRKSHDAASWIQKFTPRRKRSVWSKINTQHAVRLINEKRMKPAGLKEIESAKTDGRWTSAYDSPKNSAIPEDFLKLLARNKKAEAFFHTLN